MSVFHRFLTDQQVKRRRVAENFFAVFRGKNNIFDESHANVSVRFTQRVSPQRLNKCVLDVR